MKAGEREQFVASRGEPRSVNAGRQGHGVAESHGSVSGEISYAFVVGDLV